MATKLVITFTQTTNTAPVTVNIPSALRNLDSGQVFNSQTGFSAVDTMVRNMFRAGVFTDGNGNWYATAQIAAIVAQ